MGSETAEDADPSAGAPLLGEPRAGARAGARATEEQELEEHKEQEPEEMKGFIAAGGLPPPSHVHVATHTRTRATCVMRV